MTVSQLLFNFPTGWPDMIFCPSEECASLHMIC
jgi:hypothetical protein